MTLAAHAVCVRAGGRPVLDRVSLAVRDGEVVALLGPNGAGKSTLLSVLAGDAGLAAGAVTLDGRPLGSWRIRALAKRRAVLPQTEHLVFPFPVRDVVAFGRSPHESRRSTGDAALIDAMLKRVGAAHLAAVAYTELSGGERRRIQLARALVQVWGDSAAPPGIALLDEHTAHLDPAFQHATCRLLRECAERGMGLLAVMHDINLALDYADRIAFLNGGRLLFAGDAAAARSPALLEQVFGVPFRLVGDGFVTVDAGRRLQARRRAL